MAIRSTGFDAVERELKRMRAAQSPTIAKAIDDAAKFGNQLAVDGVFNKYGFNSRSYVEQHLGYSINPKTLTGTIYGRYRPSTLNRYATPRYRTGKRGQQVANGHTIRTIRNEPKWFRSTFQFLGKNGNQVMYMRLKGETWRTFKEAKKAGVEAKYGPSVAGSFGYMRDDLEPPIIAHLRKKYGQYAK
ncbi:hypothetical protein [Shewanella sp. MEBiC00475]|uniref:hypothetical protein n=1 Tax=Shewanella sp. MEBiC00475 TaxID=2575361 RepID=UPI0010C01D67|nr:hypothetical protein [Shewanella sp. MEBiC00475]